MSKPEGFPFEDGERITVEDEASKRYTVTCRYKYITSHSRGGTESTPVSCTLTTTTGDHVNYDQATQKFEILGVPTIAAKRVGG
jgi:hypothetical protein